MSKEPKKGKAPSTRGKVLMPGGKPLRSTWYKPAPIPREPTNDMGKKAFEIHVKERMRVYSQSKTPPQSVNDLRDRGADATLHAYLKAMKEAGRSPTSIKSVDWGAAEAGRDWSPEELKQRQMVEGKKVKMPNGVVLESTWYRPPALDKGMTGDERKRFEQNERAYAQGLKAKAAAPANASPDTIHSAMQATKQQAAQNIVNAVIDAGKAIRENGSGSPQEKAAVDRVYAANAEADRVLNTESVRDQIKTMKKPELVKLAKELHKELGAVRGDGRQNFNQMSRDALARVIGQQAPDSTRTWADPKAQQVHEGKFMTAFERAFDRGGVAANSPASKSAAVDAGRIVPTPEPSERQKANAKWAETLKSFGTVDEMRAEKAAARDAARARNQEIAQQVGAPRPKATDEQRSERTRKAKVQRTKDSIAKLKADADARKSVTGATLETAGKPSGWSDEARDASAKARARKVVTKADIPNYPRGYTSNGWDKSSYPLLSHDEAKMKAAELARSAESAQKLAQGLEKSLNDRLARMQQALASGNRKSEDFPRTYDTGKGVFGKGRPMGQADAQRHIEDMRRQFQTQIDIERDKVARATRAASDVKTAVETYEKRAAEAKGKNPLAGNTKKMAMIEDNRNPVHPDRAKIAGGAKTKLPAEAAKAEAQAQKYRRMASMLRDQKPVNPLSGNTKTMAMVEKPAKSSKLPKDITSHPLFDRMPDFKDIEAKFGARGRNQAMRAYLRDGGHADLSSVRTLDQKVVDSIKPALDAAKAGNPYEEVVKGAQKQRGVTMEDVAGTGKRGTQNAANLKAILANRLKAMQPVQIDAALREMGLATSGSRAQKEARIAKQAPASKLRMDALDFYEKNIDVARKAMADAKAESRAIAKPASEGPHAIATKPPKSLRVTEENFYPKSMSEAQGSRKAPAAPAPAADKTPWEKLVAETDAARGDKPVPKRKGVDTSAPGFKTESQKALDQTGKRQQAYQGEPGADGIPTAKARSQLLREARGKIPGAEKMETRTLAKKLGYNLKYALPIGIAAGALIAMNRSAEAGETKGQQAVAGAKEVGKGAVMAGAFMGVGAGLTAGLMRAGVTAAKAVPGANLVMMAGGAIHGAVTAEKGQRLAGAAKGAWDMSLPGAIVNTGIAVKDAATSTMARAAGPALNPEQAARYSAAAKRFGAMQQAAITNDASHKRKGWSNAARIAAAKSRGATDLPYGGNPASGPAQWAPASTTGMAAAMKKSA